MSPSPWQARELLHVLAQPDATQHRPCAGCTRGCRAHVEPTCTCECRVDCSDAPSSLVAGRTLTPDLTPIVWALACLRVFVADAGDAGVELRTSSLVLPGLLAERLDELTREGALRVRWRVRVLPIGGIGTHRIEPEHGPVDAADAAAVGAGLLEWIRARARAAIEGEALEALSRRERVVLLGITDGASVRTLARRLFVSSHTVRNQLKSIYEKLDVGSQDDLRERFAGRSAPFEVALGRERRPSRPPRLNRVARRSS